MNIWLACPLPDIHITGQKHEVVSCMHAARCEHLLGHQHMYALITQTTVTTQPQLCCTCTFHLLSRDLSDGPCPPRVNTQLYKRADIAFRCRVQVGLKLLVEQCMLYQPSEAVKETYTE